MNVHFYYIFRSFKCVARQSIWYEEGNGVSSDTFVHLEYYNKEITKCNLLQRWLALKLFCIVQLVRVKVLFLLLLLLSFCWLFLSCSFRAFFKYSCTTTKQNNCKHFSNVLFRAMFFCCCCCCFVIVKKITLRFHNCATPNAGFYLQINMKHHDPHTIPISTNIFPINGQY